MATSDGLHDVLERHRYNDPYGRGISAKALLSDLLSVVQSIVGGLASVSFEDNDGFENGSSMLKIKGENGSPVILVLYEATPVEESVGAAPADGCSDAAEVAANHDRAEAAAPEAPPKADRVVSVNVWGGGVEIKEEAVYAESVCSTEPFEDNVDDDDDDWADASYGPRNCADDGTYENPICGEPSDSTNNLPSPVDERAQQSTYAVEHSYFNRNLKNRTDDTNDDALSGNNNDPTTSDDKSGKNAPAYNLRTNRRDCYVSLTRVDPNKVKVAATPKRRKVPKKDAVATTRSGKDRSAATPAKRKRGGLLATTRKKSASKKSTVKVDDASLKRKQNERTLRTCRYCKIQCRGTDAFVKHHCTELCTWELVDGKFKRFMFCRICGEKLPDAYHRDRHERSHTGVKPFSCDDCGKRFSVAQRLQIHVRAKHTGERPYRCSRCPKAYCSNHDRNVHERSHWAVKPYKCGRCAKTFITNGARFRHELVHKKRKPFPCSNCPKTFSKKVGRDHHEHRCKGIDRLESCYNCRKQSNNGSSK